MRKKELLKKIQRLQDDVQLNYSNIQSLFNRLEKLEDNDSNLGNLADRVSILESTREEQSKKSDIEWGKALNEMAKRLNRIEEIEKLSPIKDDCGGM